MFPTATRVASVARRRERPPTPLNVATLIDSLTQITVSAGEAGAGLSYRLYMSTESGTNYTLVDESETPVIAAADLEAGTVYYFVMASVKEGVESLYSEEVSADPGMYAAGVVASYRMEGNANDSGPNGLNLSKSESGATITYVGGKIGQAVSIPGNVNYLYHADDAVFRGGVQWWGSSLVRLTSVAINRAIVSKYGANNAASDYLIFYRKVANRFCFQTYVGSTAYTLDANTFGAPSLNTWYHLFWLYNGTKIKLAVNGVFDELAVTGTPNGLSAPFNIGSYNNGAAECMLGLIDGVALGKPSAGWLSTDTNDVDLCAYLYDPISGNGRQF